MQILIAILLAVSTIANSASDMHNLEDYNVTRELDKMFWLEILGMNHEPINFTRPKEKRSAPDYLMNIYSNTVTKLTLDYTSYDLTNYDLEKAKENNMIVSFNSLLSSTQPTMHRLWYNVVSENSQVDYQEVLTSADLRLYRDSAQTSDDYQGLPFNITVYRHEKGEDDYVNSVVVDADHQGWIVINITSCVQWWIDHPEDNEGLGLLVTPIRKNSLVQHVQFEDVGVSGLDGEPIKFPFLVGYYKTIFYGDYVPGCFFQYKRSASSYLNALEKKIVKYRESYCQLRELYINFDQVGYHEWIIAPDGFEANDCIGKCDSPFGSNIDVQPHGVVKMLMQMNGLSPLIGTACRPIKYSAGNILFWTDENVTVLKRIENLSASACGCR